MVHLHHRELSGIVPSSIGILVEVARAKRTLRVQAVMSRCEPVGNLAKT
jgi:hypothetical protein